MAINIYAFRWLNYKLLASVYLLLVLVVYFHLTHSVGGANNFNIYSASVGHFFAGADLYVPYPQEHFDLFLYHPIFPMLFSPFGLLPPDYGLLLWLLASAFGCFYAITTLPLSHIQKKLFIALMIFPLLNNLQDCQTNILLLACMLLSYSLLKRKHYFGAALFIVLGFLIKGYGGIVGLLVLFERRPFTIITNGIACFILFHLLALAFIPASTLLQYYQEWTRLITSDEIIEHFSVYGLLQAVGWRLHELYVLIPACLWLAAVFLAERSRQKRQDGRLMAFLLIWVIVFNRSSESPSYIIAFAGMVLWFYCMKPLTHRQVFFAGTILFAFIFPTHVIAIIDKWKYEYHLPVVLFLIILIDITISSITRLPKHNPKTVTYEIRPGHPLL